MRPNSCKQVLARFSGLGNSIYNLAGVLTRLLQCYTPALLSLPIGTPSKQRRAAIFFNRTTKWIHCKYSQLFLLFSLLHFPLTKLTNIKIFYIVNMIVTMIGSLVETIILFVTIRLISLFNCIPTFIDYLMALFNSLLGK